MKRIEVYQLHLSDVLESCGLEYVMIRGVRLDAKVSCSFRRLGPEAEPELTGTVSPDAVYLRHEYLAEPLKLDQTALTHVHKLLYEDFLTEVERLALEFASGPKARWEFDAVQDVGCAGDEHD